MYNLSEKELDRYLILQRIRDREVTQKEGASLLGMSTRQVRRLSQRVLEEGVCGIKGRQHGGNRSHPEIFKAQVLSAVRINYHDFGPTFAAEKLLEREGLQVNKETLRQWMMEAGIWRGRKRKSFPVHQSRQRRSCFGELVQIDGSHHDWLEGRAPKCCLIVMIDDATSRIQYMQFEESETTVGYFKGVLYCLNKNGRPIAFYSDKHGIFITLRPEKGDGLYKDTQFHRAMRDLDIELICANSPQAKGRVERVNKTLQDRLIKEMRLREIHSIEEANAYLPEFIEAHNAKFGVEPFDVTNVHRKVVQEDASLRRILSKQSQRKLSKNLEVSYGRTLYQIQRPGGGYRYRHAAVMIHEHLDGEIEITHGTELLAYKKIDTSLKPPHILDRKEINIMLDKNLAHRPSPPEKQINLFLA